MRYLSDLALMEISCFPGIEKCGHLLCQYLLGNGGYTRLVDEARNVFMVLGVLHQ